MRTVFTIDGFIVGSKSRNKLIAKIFKEAGLIERYGSGIMRVRRICKEYGVVEPSFGEMANGFKVTLFKELTMNEYANNSLIVSDFKVDIKKELEKDTVKQTEKGTEKLSKNQLLILNYITENKNITIEELTSRIAISASKVKANISKLKQKGFLQRIGPDKGGLLVGDRTIKLTQNFVPLQAEKSTKTTTHLPTKVALSGTTPTSILIGKYPWKMW